MPSIPTFDLFKWLHLVAASVAAGGAVVALLLSGFEDTREDLRGLSAAVWKRVVTWGFRFAVLLGLVLLGLKLHRGEHPFDYRYLHLKVLVAFALLALSEVSPKALARAQRGAPMLALLLFLLTSFLAVAGASLLGLTQRGLERTAVPTPTVQAR